MNYHLAISNGHEPAGAHLAGHPNVLASYANPQHIRRTMTDHLGQPSMLGKGRLIIDSGAFSAYRSGQVIDVHRYAEFLLEFTEKHAGTLASLEYVNLDVIGNPVASTQNLRTLRGYGLTPLPVFGFGLPLDDLRRMAAETPRLALGGMVPHSKDRATLNGWLTRCFDALNGTDARIHLLGIAHEWVLMKFPAESADSSGFSRATRFEIKVHRAKYEHLSLHDLKRRALADEIHAIQALEARINRHWNARQYVPSGLTPLLHGGVL